MEVMMVNAMTGEVTYRQRTQEEIAELESVALEMVEKTTNAE